MGIFKPSVITEKGASLSTKVLADITDLQFTRVALSDSRLTGDISKLTELGVIRQTSDVSGITREDSRIKIDAVFSNQFVNQGYYIRAVGLYATDPDEGEILYSISVADESEGSADWMPPKSTSSVTSLALSIALVMSNSAEVNVSVNPTAYATVQQLNELRDATRLNRNVIAWVDGTNGNDITGDGTEDRPYKTIQKAVDMCPVNLNGYTYTIRLISGTYDEEVFICKNGTITIKGAGAIADSDKFIVSNVFCLNSTYVNLQGIKFTGDSNSASKVGVIAQASMVVVSDCKFVDCIARSTVGAELNLTVCDLSNYRSGTTPYGVVHANGGVIKCYMVSGTNNSVGYGGGVNSGTGGDIYVSSNCTLSADLLIIEAYSGRVRVDSGRYVQIAEVTGETRVDLTNVVKLYSELYVVQKHSIDSRAHIVTHIIPISLLTKREMWVFGGSGASGVTGAFECNGTVEVTNSYIKQQAFNLAMFDGNELASTTMEVYARRA